jgi:hypothetical protein
MVPLNTKERWPNFLVIGAAKCGTTSLYHYLKSHPEVYMSPIKETNYFSTDIDPSRFSPLYQKIENQKRLNLDEYVQGDMKREVWGYFVRDKNHYTALFKKVTHQKAIGEVSNSYLFSETAAREIYRTLPEVKLIAILRHPVERMYSHYLANLRDGKTSLPFRKEIEKDFNQKEKGWYINHGYVEMGFYSTQLKRYLDLFPPKQIKILLYDQLKKHPQKLMEEICRFLSIRTDWSFPLDQRFNESRIPRNTRLLYWLSTSGIKKSLFRLIPESYKAPVKNLFFKNTGIPELNPEDYQFAASFYWQEIPALEMLTGLDLSSWLTVIRQRCESPV